MDENDEVLIAQIRTGDEDALAKFIDLRRPQLLAFIERRLGRGCGARSSRTTCFRKRARRRFAV